jgi:hypothetical protein
MGTIVKLLAFTPAAAVGNIYIANSGISRGDLVAQVIDMTTGADVTSSFDPYILDTNTITQLNITPSSADQHLAILASTPSTALDFKIAVVNSLGSAGGTHGSVTAAGVTSGDIILAALYPLDNTGTLSVSLVTDSFAATAPSTNVVTQISGVATAHPVLLFLLKSGHSSSSFMVAMAPGMATGINNATRTGQSGDAVEWAIDLNTGASLTGTFGPYIPYNDLVYNPGAGVSHTVMFVFQHYP